MSAHALTVHDQNDSRDNQSHAGEFAPADALVHEAPRHELRENHFNDAERAHLRRCRERKGEWRSESGGTSLNKLHHRVFCAILNKGSIGMFPEWDNAEQASASATRLAPKAFGERCDHAERHAALVGRQSAKGLDQAHPLRA